MFEGFVTEEVFANGTVASVIAEDKGGSKLVHLALGFSCYFDRAIVLGEFARFVIDSCRDQKRANLLRGIVRLAHALKRFQELF